MTLDDLRPNRPNRIPKPEIRTAERKESRIRGSTSRGAEKNLMIIIVIATVALLALTVVAAIWLFGGKTPPPYQPTNQTVVVNQTPQINTTQNLTNVTVDLTNATDSELIKLAVSNKQWKLCEKVNNTVKKEECYEAVADYNLTACLRVENVKKQEKCVVKHATDLKSIEVCVSIANSSVAKKCRETVDSCYYKLGSAEWTCRALLTNNYTKCNNDKECIFEYAEKKRDYTPCGKLSETAEQFACIAVAKREDECSKLTLTTQRDSCRQIYAVRTNYSLWCSGIEADSIYALGCYSHFASQDNNMTLCNKLSLDNRWSCYKNYSIETMNSTACEHINKYATTNLFDCFWKYAKFYGDPSACEPMNDSGFRYSCYIGAIMNNTKLDYRNCENISVPEWKNKCYMQAAKNKKNETICDYIKTELERKSCVATVQAVKP